jgi:MYXO-CTERM domain-containing protein
MRAAHGSTGTGTLWQTGPMNTMQGLLLVSMAVVLTMAPSAVDASCAPPLPEIFWVYPSDGQTDVSIWAELYVAVPMGVTVHGSANGEELNAVEEGLGRFVWSEGLDPNTEYKVHLVVSGVLPSEDPNIPASITQDIVFTTGAGSDPPGTPAFEPQVTTYGLQEGIAHLNEACQAIVWGADCYDTGQDTFLTLETQDPDAVGWLIDRIDSEGNQSWSRYWPAECGHPGVLLHGSAVEEGTVGCYALRALHGDGIGARYPMSCDPFVVGGWVPPEPDPNESPKGEGSGCAWSRTQSSGSPMVLLMALFALLAWRRRVRLA